MKDRIESGNPASPSQSRSALESVKNRRLATTGLWALAAGGGAYLYSFEPGRTGFFLTCPFHSLTGLNCPGCGTTRALHQLLHGNLVAAFELNPLAVLTLPVLGYFLLAYTRLAASGHPMPQLSISPKYGWLIAAVILGFWIFRNTSIYPFST